MAQKNWFYHFCTVLLRLSLLLIACTLPFSSLVEDARVEIVLSFSLNDFITIVNDSGIMLLLLLLLLLLSFDTSRVLLILG